MRNPDYSGYMGVAIVLATYGGFFRISLPIAQSAWPSNDNWTNWTPTSRKLPWTVSFFRVMIDGSIDKQAPQERSRSPIDGSSHIRCSRAALVR